MRTRTWLSILILLSMLLVLVPSLTSVSAAPGAAPLAEACGPSVTHVVLYGENLFRISLRYGTTMAAVATANGITNYALIYAGQILRIPCAGAVPVYIPTPPLPPSYPTPYPTPYYIPGVTTSPLSAICGSLAPTSPLEGMGNGNMTFYWDPAPGATSYRLNFYSMDYGGIHVASFDTDNAFSTNLTVNTGLGTLGWGMRFSWEVQALVSDIPVCTSRRVTMLREWDE
jgi:LysM repeat protein